MRVDNAVILAAGMGERCVPVTYYKHKGLISIKGDLGLVENQIKQCMEKGIRDITIVTGYRSNDYQDLLKKYPNVDMVYNELYSSTNNIYSLYLVKDILKNTYILSCDNYYKENIFNTDEKAAWYCVVKSNSDKQEWGVDLKDSGRISKIYKKCNKNQYYMFGAVFFDNQLSDKIREYLKEYIEIKNMKDCLWEQILIDNIENIEIYANKKDEHIVYEIDSFQDLQNLDKSYIYDSKNYIIEKLYDIFKADRGDIGEFYVQKGGMTNNSFTFRVKDKKYICRLSCEKSGNFIDRDTEKLVYDTISHLNISDETVYFDVDEGIKISKFFENSRTLNPYDDSELKASMKFLKDFHKNNIQIDKFFDLKSEIEKYEKLCLEININFSKDYYDIKKEIFDSLDLIKYDKRNRCLCHIDYISENILVLQDMTLKLIDWEYACMCEPIMDIAMFYIFSYNDDTQIDKIVYYYFDDIFVEYDVKNRIKVYMAAAGFLWYLWSTYKYTNEDGLKEYSKRMYDYAKKIFDYKKYLSV